jgi:hypothetical protein
VRPPPAGRCAVVFPAALDPEFVRTFGYTERAGELEPLLAALDERIGSRQGCVRGVREMPDPAGAPRVYVGSADSDSAILVQLGVSQYVKGCSGVFRKDVALGTAHRRPLKFLTTDDKPAEVLHPTGVLVDGQGRVVRAGAEGIVLRDTRFLEIDVALDKLIARLTRGG